MNVLEIANYAAPYAGNFILSLANLESKLDGGCMVYLFPAEAKSKEYTGNLEHVYFFTGSLLADTLLIRKIIKEHGIEVVHSHFASSQHNLILLLALTFKSQILYVKHEHGEVQQARGYKKYIRQFLRSRVDVYVPCNFPISGQLEADDVSSTKIKAVPNAIDFSRLDVYETLARGEEKQVLMFGSDWYRKGGDIAIKAIQQLDRVRLNIALSSGLEQVKDYIRAEFGELPAFITFLAPRNDVATYYRMADVFISPSRSEGLPYAVIEAMYCETLLVISDIAPQQNLVPDECMFRAEDVSQLSEKIQNMLNKSDKDLLKQLLRNKAIEKFNLDGWSQQILNIYTENRKNVSL